jgi:two-component system alkaline phosphatase synthesis response regulator PhoP/two-component system response regulator VicR
MSKEAKTLLLVDDEPDLLESISIRLKATGYQVETAVDGLEALKKARSLKPDLILLDLMLPKMDGYKVARLLKFDGRYSRIPILILSARSQDLDKEMASSAGADDYLVKPFSSEELLSRIEKLLQRR